MYSRHLAINFVLLDNNKIYYLKFSAIIIVIMQLHIMEQASKTAESKAT